MSGFVCGWLIPNRWLKILSKWTSPIFSKYFWVTLLTLKKCDNNRLGKQHVVVKDGWHGCWCCVCIPGIWQDDFLAGSCSWSALAFLHGHQVADISQHCFEVSHLQLSLYVDRQSQQLDWRVVEELVVLARRDFSTSCARSLLIFFLDSSSTLSSDNSLVPTSHL